MPIIVVRKMDAAAAVGCAVAAFVVVCGGATACAWHHSPANTPLRFGAQIAAYAAGAALLSLIVATVGTSSEIMALCAPPAALQLEGGTVAATELKEPSLVPAGLGVACATLIPAVGMAVAVATAAFAAPNDTQLQMTSWITLGTAVLAMLLMAPSIGLFATLGGQVDVSDAYTVERGQR
jgi:hypothetical protein